MAANSGYSSASVLMLLPNGYHLRQPTCHVHLSIQPQHEPHIKTLFPAVQLLCVESPTVPLVLCVDLLLQKHILVAVETCSLVIA
jgi:hypothetical protein